MQDRSAFHDKDTAPSGPELRPGQLRFADDNLERAFRRRTAAYAYRVVQFASLLSAGLFALFAAVDIWVAPGKLAITFALRGLIVSTCLISVRFMSKQRFIERHQPYSALLATMALVGTVGVLSPSPTEASTLYYPGIILCFVGIHLLLFLRFLIALAISAAGTVLYLTTITIIHDHPHYVILTQATYILSGLFLSAMGGYVSEMHQRLSFLRQHQLELEHQHARHEALHDELTGLPNRKQIIRRLQERMAYCDQQGGYIGLIFIDLDGFKRLNDLYGHTVGDKALRRLARHLQDAVGGNHTVGRLAGDEFVVVTECLTTPAPIHTLLQTVHEAINEQAAVKVRGIAIQVSMGLALYPADGRDVESLLESADARMYNMKRGAPAN